MKKSDKKKGEIIAGEGQKPNRRRRGMQAVLCMCLRLGCTMILYSL